MAGQGDPRNPDDVKLHLGTIAEADDAQRLVPEAEIDEQRLRRESRILPARLRARVDQSLVELGEQVPGLTAAETEKLLASRAGRDALGAGHQALGRVDDHLQSVTSERNPIIGKRYGVYGDNPSSFGGVMRSLELSSEENARLEALPADAEERSLLFTPYIEREVERARDGLAAILGTRIGTRAALSRAVNVKAKTLDDAQGAISDVMRHLYANLPERKRDPDLRDYGFRPLSRTGPRRKVQTGEEPPAES